ncbi:MAG: nuclear transport factor 2 family protein [Bacteroidales bacterium]
MKSHGINLIVVSAFILILSNPANSQPEQQKSKSDKISLPDSLFFKALVSQYVQSIDQADTTLASKIWAPTEEISFINPEGTEYGWNGVKNIYKRFKDNFSARKLSFFNVKFSYGRDVSWLTFYWTFDGTLKLNNSSVRTRGRETQIWRKINYEWRLVHVHYSEMPVTDKGQGL